MRWDNITILQAVDRNRERYGGGDLWGVDGRQLMDDVAGAQVTDDMLVRGFVRELEIAAAEGYLTYRINDYAGTAQQIRNTQPYQYLQRINGFALTVKGQDRARGIRVVQLLPNPAEDDGRAISALILQQIASAIAEEYTPQQILVFVHEAGIPLDRLPLPEETPDVRSDRGGFVRGVLVGLDRWNSEGRRILREFIGSWLDDRFISGPTGELRTDLIEKLARRGGTSLMATSSLEIRQRASGYTARYCGMLDWPRCTLRSWQSPRSYSGMTIELRPSSRRPRPSTTGSRT